MSKFFKKTACKAVMAFVLSLVLILGWQPLIGILAAQNDNLEPSSKHETIFANLDHNGNVVEMVAVNSFIRPGESVADFGEFTKIINLTNDTVPEIEKDRVLFNEVAEGTIFRYQGTLGHTDLPWNFNIAYYLDGKNMEADELAGASGKLRIVIDAAYNPEAHPYFTENFMVQIRIPLQMDKAFSIKAPDASLMFVGNTATVAFTLMPNSSRQFFLEADVISFTLDGIDIAAMKAVVPANEDIDEIESGFEDMADGTQELIEGTEQLEQGMVELNDGVGELFEGSADISRGIRGLTNGLGEFSNGLLSMESGLNEITVGSEGFKQALNAMSEAMPKLTGGYERIESGLDSMLANREQINALASSLAQSQDPQVKMLAEAMLMKIVGLSELQGGLHEANEGLSIHAGGIREISSGFEEFNQGLRQSAQGVHGLNVGFNDMKTAARRLASGTQSLSGGLGNLKDNIVTLPEDVNKLVEGQKDLKEGVLLARDEIRQFTVGNREIESVSFVSPNRAKAETVQFVMRTPAIEVLEIERIEEQVVQNRNFWDRLIDLFRKLVGRWDIVGNRDRYLVPISFLCRRTQY